MTNLTGLLIMLTKVTSRVVSLKSKISLSSRKNVDKRGFLVLYILLKWKINMESKLTMRMDNYDGSYEENNAGTLRWKLI